MHSKSPKALFIGAGILSVLGLFIWLNGAHIVQAVGVRAPAASIAPVPGLPEHTWATQLALPSPNAPDAQWTAQQQRFFEVREQYLKAANDIPNYGLPTPAPGDNPQYNYWYDREHNLSCWSLVGVG